MADTEPGAEAPLPLLEGRGLVDGKPAAYVCENYACRLPVTSVEALSESTHRDNYLFALAGRGSPESPAVEASIFDHGLDMLPLLVRHGGFARENKA